MKNHYNIPDSTKNTSKFQNNRKPPKDHAKKDQGVKRSRANLNKAKEALLSINEENEYNDNLNENNPREIVNFQQYLQHKDNYYKQQQSSSLLSAKNKKPYLIVLAAITLFMLYIFMR